jgi:hypothetical protein
MKTYLVQRVTKEDLEVQATSKKEAKKKAMEGFGYLHEVIIGSVTYGKIEELK